MRNTFQFTDLLEQYVNRVGYNTSQLARLSDLPHRTVANWLEGRVRKPRTREDLLKVAKALHLSAGETTNLLKAADYPSIEELWRLSDGRQNRELLAPWAEAINQRSKKAPFQALPDLPYFVGREAEIQDIRKALLGGYRVSICSLQGMGGVGKTVLAAHLAYQLQTHFPDGVLWARVDTSDTMSILSTFAAAYGRDVSSYIDLDSRGRIVRELLANKRVLMILDNARCSSEIEPLLPPTGTCSVLVTSRHQNLFAAAGAHCFQIGPFNEEKHESLRLFAQILGDDLVRQEKATFLKIARLLGHLPLAVAIVASRLAYEPGWSAAALLKRLRQEKRRLNEVAYENQSARISTDISYEALSPAQKFFFATLGAFAGENLNLEAVAAVNRLTQDETEDKLRKLYALSLVQIGQSGYRLHPLLRDYARDKLEASEEKDGIAQRWVTFFTTYMQIHEGDYTVLHNEFDNLVTALEVAYTQDMQDSLLKGVSALAPFLKNSGFYTLARTHLQRARDIASVTTDKVALANVTFYLGDILFRQGNNREAEPYLSESLVLARQTNNQKLLSMILADIGSIRIHEGHYEQGNAYLDEGLALARQVGDPETLCTLLAYIGTRASRRGGPLTAEAFYREGLTLAQQNKIPQREVIFLNNLGVVAFDRADDCEAEEYFQQSLVVARRFNFQEAICLALNNLGEIAFRRQEISQAENYYHEGLEIGRKIEHQAGMSVLLQNLGELAMHRGDYGQAIAFYEEGYQLAQQRESKTTVCAMLRGLTKVALAQNNQTAAETYFQQCLSLVDQIHDYAMFFSELNDWGELFLGQGKLDLAMVAFEKVLALAEMIHSQLGVALGRYGLAQLMAAHGEPQRAEEEGRKCLQQLESIPHPKAAAVRRWLSLFRP